MLHLGLAAQRFDAIVKVPHNTWMLYADNALLRHEICLCSGWGGILLMGFCHKTRHFPSLVRT